MNMNTEQQDNWRVWNDEKEYGEVLFKRASGILPEMESSKAAAKIVGSKTRAGDKILDVGCGAGHYLRSLLNELHVPFHYQGLDATQHYVELARKAWGSREFDNLLSHNFSHGDIFKIPFQSSFGEIVMCNNVLLHLPSIEQPIRELVRVASKFVVIRALVGNASFKIKQVREPEVYDESGEPVNFHYYNIYSEDYIKSILDGENGIKRVDIYEDQDYNARNIELSQSDHKNNPKGITTIVNGMQVNNYIIQPWKFVVIEKEES